MMVADGHGQRIGRVGRTDRLFEAKERLNHLLDLAFARGAISCDSAFYLQRAIFRDSKPVLRGSQNRDPSRLTQLERALYIFREDKAFDRCPLRLITTDQLGQAAVDLLQAGGKRVVRRGNDAAVFYGSQCAVTASHHPVAGRAGPRINP